MERVWIVVRVQTMGGAVVGAAGSLRCVVGGYAGAIPGSSAALGRTETLAV
ncbi:transmembrane anti-sigma factor [Streptomyces laurentii]|uniref:Transmembrane anti-sigma factor n=1 Tax=Streptomyces laurentii TaxID=39478 RepID=A0A160P112_STRLU|nr:transmembrane anti-sigma factor [Streptomyces laurentii]